MRAYISEYAPPAYDPFAGGGSIPLEAQRLGLEAHASDLNPVAVLINKALIEIPPKFKDMPPVNSKSRETLDMGQWCGAQGLAEDVRYYGQWMRDEAFKRIGHLYPQVELPEEYGGGRAKVIAWLWARTVTCPNPACGCQMPLIQSFALSTKRGNKAWLEPQIDYSGQLPTIRFHIQTNDATPPPSPKIGRGAKFICLACKQPAGESYIKSEGVSGRMGKQHIATVAKGHRRRIFLEPGHLLDESDLEPNWQPEVPLGVDKRSLFTPLYGLTHFYHLFTRRQLTALSTFSELVNELESKIKSDCCKQETLLASCEEYTKAIQTYLSIGVSRSADYWSNICTWRSDPKNLGIGHVFSMQAIPMVWDFAEANPFSDSSGNWKKNLDWIVRVLLKLPARGESIVRQLDIAQSEPIREESLISTDPPYHDNIGYADVADFFHVWLRRNLRKTYPDLFSTLVTPKQNELVVVPYRFKGGKKEAQKYFERSFQQAFSQIREISSTAYPLTIYYAFKQSEEERDSESQGIQKIASTGWENMLTGMIDAGLMVNGTWPIRTEMVNRSTATGTNALASSIVLVCNSRTSDATKITRRQFLLELKQKLPKALKTLQQGNIAPVDLAQASIGPGMAIFSKYAAVLESDGTPMRVRTALQLINQILDEYLTEQEGEFDTDTRWALTWYEQYQFTKAPYGEAETLSKAKNTSVQGLVNAGILEAESGKVCLLSRSDLPENWDPNKDNRTPDWEATQHLIRLLETQGEISSAHLLSQLGSKGENARDLAYRLYTLCDRKGWSKEALAYNSLVIAWPEISRLANEQKRAEPYQTSLSI